MKRRMSGWLAWISLALIIGVPSSEVFLSKVKQDGGVQKDSLNEVSTSRNSDNLHVLNFDNENSDEQVISETSSLTTKKKKSPVKQVSESQKQPYSVIPIEFRILGDQTVIVSDANIKSSLNKSNPQGDISNSSPRIVGDEGMAIGSANIALDKKIKEESSYADMIISNSQTIKVENGIDETFLLAQSKENAIDEASAIEEENVIEIVKNESGAQKNNMNVLNSLDQIADLQNLQKKTAVNGSVNVINVSQKQTFRHVDFYDLVEADRNSIASVSTNNFNRQRLDRVKNNNNQSTVEIIKPVTQVEFYELHQTEQRPQKFVVNGSFLTQLPVNRGSLIRLDMVN